MNDTCLGPDHDWGGRPSHPLLSPPSTELEGVGEGGLASLSGPERSYIDARFQCLAAWRLYTKINVFGGLSPSRIFGVVGRCSCPPTDPLARCLHRGPKAKATDIGPAALKGRPVLTLDGF